LCSISDPSTTEIYTLSLHDALPIYVHRTAVDEHVGEDRPRTEEHNRRIEHEQIRETGCHDLEQEADGARQHQRPDDRRHESDLRSEEHTSELQSLAYLVCRLLLEKK